MGARGKLPPVTKAAPKEVVRAAPAIKKIPVVKSEPVAAIIPEIAASETSVVEETIAAASDLAAASPEAVSGAVGATAGAVTAEVVETVFPTKPPEVAASRQFTPSQLSPQKVTQGMKTMMKSTEDLVAFGQANLEACVKSGQIWSAGVQELTKQMASTAKATFEESVTTFKAISTAKSVKEAMEMQSSFAKAALEKAMTESNKLTDASIKLTEQTLAPITARVTVAVETFGKAA
jgi:phasin family protein